MIKCYFVVCTAKYWHFFLAKYRAGTRKAKERGPLQQKPRPTSPSPPVGEPTEREGVQTFEFTPPPPPNQISLVTPLSKKSFSKASHADFRQRKFVCVYGCHGKLDKWQEILHCYSHTKGDLDVRWMFNNIPCTLQATKFATGNLVTVHTRK
jgi:hypothetical protein